MRIHDTFHCSVLKQFLDPVAFAHPAPALPVLRPPPALELILGHKRKRGGAYHFSIKYLDEPLPADPFWLSEADARLLSPTVVDLYKQAHNI